MSKRIRLNGKLTRQDINTQFVWICSICEQSEKRGSNTGSWIGINQYGNQHSADKGRWAYIGYYYRFIDLPSLPCPVCSDIDSNVI